MALAIQSSSRRGPKRIGRMSQLNFLKPADEALFEEDRPDIDTNSGTSFIYNPFLSRSLDHQKKCLPIYECRQEIVHLVEVFQTVVLVGETGCGKSTQIPQYLFDAGFGEGEKMIGITQPRRVAATTLASRVSDEMGVILGEEVGYAIRFDEKINPKTTKIKYMTEGLLIREMMSDPLLRQYAVIMLDEVHERTVNSDILLGLLRKILKRRRDLKLIVSSATFDAEELVEFFDFRDKADDNAPHTAVPMSVFGRSFPLTVCFSIDPVPDYVKESVNVVIKVHEGEPIGDILVFLTGQDEVDTAVGLLNQYYINIKGRGLKMEMVILPMYGSLPARDQLKVFQHAPHGSRKVVVATNIAETSITISGIVYVVDCGFVKMRWYNPQTLTDSLVVVPTSKAAAVQRAGRAGRTKPGKVYRLYQESEYMKLQDATTPEIQRNDLSQTVLQLKSLGIDNIVTFRFPAPPPSQNLVCAVELLYGLGALDASGKLTSPLGLHMSEFPLPPTFSKMLLSSGNYGCAEEVATIAALLQVETVFQSPYGQSAMKARIAKRKFEVAEGDLLTLLNVYTAYVESGRTKQFCSQNFLHYKRLRRAEEIKNQILKMLSRFGVPIESCKGTIEPIIKCICAGFFPNAAYLHHSGYHRTVRGDLPVFIHPSSLLYTLKQPQWLLFTEIIHTTHVYMRDLTVVQQEWLVELAPHFYKTRTELNH